MEVLIVALVLLPFVAGGVLTLVVRGRRGPGKSSTGPGETGEEAPVVRFCTRCGDAIVASPGKVLLREDGVAVAAEELSAIPGAVAHAACPRDGVPTSFYEFRLGAYLHEGAVPDEFGTGGEKMAHARVVVEAETFVDAVRQAEPELAAKWETVAKSAALADEEPA